MSSFPQAQQAGFAIDAYAYVTVSGGTPSIAKSNNVSSITDRGVGLFTAVPASNLPSVNYVLAGTSTTGRFIGDDTAISRAVDGVPIAIRVDNSTYADANFSFLVTGA